MANLVVLTIDHPTTRYFVNKISEDFSIDAVFIIEYESIKEKILQAINTLKNPRKFLAKVSLLVNMTLNARLDPPESKKRQIYNEILDDSWQDLKNQNVIKMPRRIFNTVEAAKEIQRFKPDMILLCAVPIVSSQIISSAGKFCLNLHKGITPDYRGTNCLLWPLYNGEPDCVGVTIHRVTEGIDSGDVANQSRYEVAPGDTPFSIYAKATVLGTELMKKTLKEIQSNNVKWLEQDLSKGRVYYMKEFTFSKKREVVKRLRRMQFPKKRM